MEGVRRSRCVICGKVVEYMFGRPRRACDNPECQRALQKLRVRRFKLKKKRIKAEGRYLLKRVQIDFYEPTYTSEDLGNPLNIGSKMEIVPFYSGHQFVGFRPLGPLTVEFVKDSKLFLQRYPDLVKYAYRIRGREKAHRTGPGELYLACNVCQSTKLIWVDQGWYCTECSNESDFSLPIF